MVELAGWYVVCDDTRRNPAGLPNDAGAEHANVRCLGSGKMEALRDIDSDRGGAILVLW